MSSRQSRRSTAATSTPVTPAKTNRSGSLGSSGLRSRNQTPVAEMMRTPSALLLLDSVSAQADEQVEAVLLALDVHDRTVLDVREDHFEARQKQNKKNYDPELLLRESAEREAKLIRLFVAMKDSAKSAVDRLSAYHQNKAASTNNTLADVLSQNTKLAAAAAEHQAEAKEAFESWQGAEAAQQDLVGELAVVRAEAFVDRQQLLDRASQQETRLIGKLHQSALTASRRLQMTEVEHKAQLRAVGHQLSAVGYSSKGETLRDSALREAKELAISNQCDLVAEVWSSSEHMLEDVRKAAGASESRIRQELIEARLSKEELCNQFVIDLKVLQKKLAAQDNRCSNAMDELTEIKKSLEAEDNLGSCTISCTTALLTNMAQLREHAIEDITQARISTQRQTRTFRAQLGVVQKGADDRDNARLLAIIEVLKRRVQAFKGPTTAADDGKDLESVIEEHMREQQENRLRIEQLTAEVRKLRQDRLSQDVEEDDLSKMAKLEAKVAALKAQIVMLEAESKFVSLPNTGEPISDNSEELEALKQQILQLEEKNKALNEQNDKYTTQIQELKEQAMNGGPAFARDPEELASNTKKAAKEVENIRQLLKNSTGDEALKLMDQLKAAEMEFAEALMGELEAEVYRLKETIKKTGGDEKIVMKQNLVAATLKLDECRERLGLPFPVHVEVQTDGVNASEREAQWNECVKCIVELGNESWSEYASRGEIKIVIRELWNSCQTMKRRMDGALDSEAILQGSLAQAKDSLDSAGRELKGATRQLADKQAETRMIQQKMRSLQDLVKELQAQHDQDIVKMNLLNDQVDNHKMKSESLQRLVDRHEKATEERLQELVGGHNDACELARSKASLNEKLLDRTAELEKLVEELELQLRK